MLAKSFIFLCLGSIFGLSILHFSYALYSIADIVVIFFSQLLCIILIYIMYCFFNKLRHHATKLNFRQFIKISWIYNLIIFFAASILFLSYGNYRSYLRLQNALKPQYYNKILNLKFQINKIPIKTDKSTQLQGRVLNNTDYDGLNLNNIQINIYGINNSQFNFEVGDIWQAQAKIKPSYAMQNPHVFDYEYYLFNNSIQAIATLSFNKVNFIQSNSAVQLLRQFNFRLYIEKLRFNLQQNTMPLIQYLEYGNVLLALGLGNQSLINKNQWLLFNNSGIGHLISISGLHITIFALLASYIPLPFIRLYPNILLHTNKRLICNGFGIIIAGLYVLISGLQIPAQRTWLMLVIIFVLYSRIQVKASLLIAGLIILIIDPWAVGSMSFWLSFLAVWCLIFISSSQYHIQNYQNKWLYKSLKIQIGISLAMIPLSIWFFSKFSIVSPVCNAVAIPIISYITMPFAVIGTALAGLFPLFASLVLKLANYSFIAVAKLCEYLVALPFSTSIQAKPNILIIILFIIAAIYALIPTKLRWRYYSIFCALPLFISSGVKIHYGEAKIIFFDVGQGSSILIATKNNNTLIDTAGAWYDSVIADKTAVPSLLAMGVNKLDNLIITHADKDHSGGINSIINNLSVKNIISSENSKHKIFTLAREKGISINNCDPKYWQVDGVLFSILYPLSTSFAQKTNNHSCVLKIQLGATSMLFTGDIERIAEDELVKEYGNLLKSDILLAPHHGSKTSSSIIFLQAVQPKYVVIQNGFLNQYGHPHIGTMKSYNDMNINSLRTDKLGAIIIDVNKNGYKIESQRGENFGRYWQVK